MRRRLRAALIAGVALAAACATGGRRPRWNAAPESVSFLVKRYSDSVVVMLDARVRALGLGVARVAPREGYLETPWYDVARRAQSRPPYDRLDSIVKFRFYVDPTQGKTRVLGECMQRIAWDPSQPERDLERMVPPGHPGWAILDSVLVVVREDSTQADSTKARPGS